MTVVDLRRRLHLAESPPDRKTSILLVDATGRREIGVFVDEVLQVYRLAETGIEPAAAALGGEVAGYIAGIARPAATAAAPRGAVVAAEAGPDASVVILLDLRSVLDT